MLVVVALFLHAVLFLHGLLDIVAARDPPEMVLEPCPPPLHWPGCISPKWVWYAFTHHGRFGMMAFLPPTNQFVSLATVVDLDKGVISWNRWMVWDEGHSSV